MIDVLRKRSGHEAKVTPTELFFDLVFVYVITQLSHTLLHDLTIRGLMQTAILLLAIWWAWIFTAWVTNWVDPDRTPVKLLLFGLMAAGLFMSMAIPEAFGTMGLVFAPAFVILQVGRSLFMVLALKGLRKASQRNFIRITLWLSLSGVFWIAGGLAEPQQRLSIWAAALGIEYAAPVVGFFVPGLGRTATADWDVEGHHIAERVSQFIIISQGESILTTGANFSEVSWNWDSVQALTAAFVGTIAMWWLYFNVAERSADRAGEASDQGHVARLIYTYLHLPIVAGIIVSAVSDELALREAARPASPSSIAAIVGSSVLFLVGNMLFRRAIWKTWPMSHVAGLAALACLAVVAPSLSTVGIGLLASAIVLVAAIWNGLAISRARSKRPDAWAGSLT